MKRYCLIGMSRERSSMKSSQCDSLLIHVAYQVIGLKNLVVAAVVC